MLTVIRDFATAQRRFAAGAQIAEADIPAAERAALIEAGHLAAPDAAGKAAPADAADPLAD